MLLEIQISVQYEKYTLNKISILPLNWYILDGGENPECVKFSNTTIVSSIEA